MSKRVLIIGAGAAGIMAAISAAKYGAKVRVLEHMPKAGIKLALTGNGKCNFTNSDVSEVHYHTKDNDFIEKILQQFTYEDCLALFQSMGIESEIRHFPYDDFGYAYPKAMNAEGFRDRLIQYAKELQVDINCNMANETVMQEIEAHNYDSLIIATGSNAYPKTGSDSSIYPYIKKLDLEFHTFLPALCALFTKDVKLSEWKGRRVKDTAVLRVEQGKKALEYACSGEIQFTEHSISGIPVMQLSRHAAKGLKNGYQVTLSVGGHSFEIHRTAGFDKSQVCSGGVATAEIDPETMQCKKHPEVYFCGEIIDVDGECGGFNLHFAWATARIAGLNAAK